MQYLAAVAGVALALGAVAAGLSLQSDASVSGADRLAPASVGVQVSGSFPTVQEMSHPVLPVAQSEGSDLPENGSYPLVQEFSHPR